MEHINKIEIQGRIGTVRSNVINDRKVVNFSVATDYLYKGKDGLGISETTWHNIVAWRGLATLAQQYIRKGSQIFLIGHLSYRKYTDANGIERFVTEIIADKIELCGSKAEPAPAPVPTPTPSVQVGTQSPKSLSNPFHDDIGDLPPDDGIPF